MRALLTSGISVLEAIEILLEKEQQSECKRILRELIKCLREGQRFSQALAAQPQVFPLLFVGMMRAAEGSSTYRESLDRFQLYSEKIDRVRSQIQSSLVYPTVLLLVAFAVSTFLLLYVVPKFAAVHGNSSTDLPWASRLLLSFGTVVERYHSFVVFILAALLVIAWFGFKKSRKEILWWKLVQLIPGAGQRVRLMNISRFYLTLGLLLQGGLPILQALSLSKDVLPLDLYGAVERAAEQISSGVGVAEAFESAALCTVVSRRLLFIGQQSASLENMLLHCADFHEQDASRWFDRMLRAFEPILMTVIGIIIGTIVVLLYLPIFELAGSL